ncbi:hypothetical protein V1634_19185 [Plantactinospora veratri]|uniref:Uncharacterized protein n=1 Tax=Plantactinospora veratri TaxID=1436122 RepID=A0ABU7SG75_9ACTN
MRLTWAALWATATVIFAVLVIILVRRVFAWRNGAAERLPEHAGAEDSSAGGRSDSGAVLSQVIIALVALAASVFFGVMTVPPATSEPPTAPTSSPQPTTPVPTEASTTPPDQAVQDVAKIVRLTNRPGVVAVTVQVDAPPSAGTEYLLVAHFRGSYQLKGRVSAEQGRHTINADVQLADPGSWRDFFIVTATPTAAADWNESTKDPILEMPSGSKEVGQSVAHQMPR